MKTYLIYIVTVVMMLCGCSSDLPLEVARTNEILPANQEIRTIDEALNIADTFFSSLSQSTRKGGRTVESVEEHFMPRTRNSRYLNSPALYIVNYANNEGFAILGVHKNAADIYAISEKGHFQVSDTTDNPGLADFFRKAELDATFAPMSLIDGFGPVFPVDNNYTVTEKVGPMLNENVQTWHQNAPFNKYCFYQKAQRLVGCGPLVLGQLLTYYEADAPFPYSYVGSDFKLAMDWQLAAEWGYEGTENEGMLDELAKYLNILGNQRFLKANYRDAFITTTESQDFRKAMVELNYYDEEKFFETPLKDKFLDVCQFLKSGSGSFKAAPLIFFGHDKSKLISNDTIGHYWVVDGYVKRAILANPQNPRDAHILYHCVWGQPSTTAFQNGYFLYVMNGDYFDPKARKLTGGYDETIPVTYDIILVTGGYRRKPYF